MHRATAVVLFLVAATACKSDLPQDVLDELPQDCDPSTPTVIDEPATWYVDNDEDGYGDPLVSTRACTAPAGYVGNDDDCDDDSSQWGLACPWSDVAISTWHGCGLHTDGELLCWGDAFQSSDATVPPAGTFRKVVSNDFKSSCALKTSGDIVCWGDEGEDYVGQHSGTWKDLTLDDDQLCALDEDDSVECFGRQPKVYPPPSEPVESIETGSRNLCRLLGDGTIECMAEPEQVPTDRVWVTFSMSSVASSGIAHLCAVSQDGELACWERGISEVFAPEGTFKDVDVGTYAACAIQTDDQLVCWGRKELVDGTPAGSFQAVSVGRDVVCAVGTDGFITCWGNDEHGVATPPDGQEG